MGLRLGKGVLWSVVDTIIGGFGGVCVYELGEYPLAAAF